MTEKNASSGIDLESSLPCKEFSEFKDALQQGRSIDDKIVYKLNTSVPTESFSELVSAKEQCTSLYQQLLEAHSRRKNGIQTCIDMTRKRVEELHAMNDSDPTLKIQLRKEQTKLRLMQNELVVEDVVKERSMKIFKERCWKSYRIPNS